MADLKTIESWAAHFGSLKGASDVALRSELDHFDLWMQAEYTGENLSVVAAKLRDHLPVYLHGWLALRLVCNAPI
ncbi:MAG: hypothetical protein KJP02_11860 [Octadecabacter sp.]|nr:hypothetical protein [Octadecabacter sp.]